MIYFLIREQLLLLQLLRLHYWRSQLNLHLACSILKPFPFHELLHKLLMLQFLLEFLLQNILHWDNSSIPLLQVDRTLICILKHHNIDNKVQFCFILFHFKQFIKRYIISYYFIFYEFKYSKNITYILNKLIKFYNMAYNIFYILYI